MGLTLNHFSIRTTALEICRDFYERVLGLTVGPRPSFPFPGVWLYRGDHADYANAVVHIIGIDPTAPAGLDKYLGEKATAQAHGTGVVDHIAFAADGLMAMLDHLQSVGVVPRERLVPGIGLYQLFLEDPDGVVIELNYAAAEKAALDNLRNGTIE
jgi:catechol 2,3-dioxygenase-like lactoylglutathione lyase family enzyme